ncbi:MAG: nucleotidyltransferase family protein [Bacteroidales bacterium]|nr:nucleotidyltransferase family protein [Bacteroidales bacterium]
MKAMILAAGLGTRLGSLTKDKPKALVPFGGRPMLEGLILRLKGQGFEDILINVHHHAEQIMQFVKEHQALGVDIRFSHEKDALLDTGGAIAFAKNFFKGAEPVLIHNVDVYSDINFRKLFEFHTRKQSMATLVVRDRETGRKLLFDEEMGLKGWENQKTGERKWVKEPHENLSSLAYSGIYVVSPDFAENIPFTGAFSIIDTWLKMASDYPIYGWFDANSLWYDLGSPDRIKRAEEELQF